MLKCSSVWKTQAEDSQQWIYCGPESVWLTHFNKNFRPSSCRHLCLTYLMLLIRVMGNSGWKGPQKVSRPTSCSKHISCEVKCDCLGLYPIRSWKLPRGKAAQCLLTASLSYWVHRESVFHCIQSEASFYFSFCLLPLGFLPCTSRKCLAPTFSCGQFYKSDFCQFSVLFENPSVFCHTELWVCKCNFV